MGHAIPPNFNYVKNNIVNNSPQKSDHGAHVWSLWQTSDAAKDGAKDGHVFWTHSRKLFGSFFVLWLVVGGVAYTSAHIVMGRDGKPLEYVEAFYLQCQILTTSGYGDYTRLHRGKNYG